MFGIINDIQKMSTNDGPGYRTSVFLKGCLLNCQWCHNPEGKRRYPEVIPYVSNCTGCGECVEVCTTNAITLVDGNKPQIDYGVCTTCLQCVKTCKTDGVVQWGKIMTVDDVMEEVMKDKPFYKQSDGGMTLSGGEPMAQPEFVLALMERAHKENFSKMGAALDTCGHAPWEEYEKVLEFTDLVLFDIKIIDTKAHHDYTGAGNEIIMENVRRMAKSGVKMRIRVPIIPERNDTKENYKATAEFVESLGENILGVDLLPYHPYAGGKYVTFGMDYPFMVGEGYDDDRLESVIDLFLDHVPEVTVGG